MAAGAELTKALTAQVRLLADDLRMRLDEIPAISAPSSAP
jgi:hypothetical protein